MHITSVGLRAWGTQGLRSRERRQVCCVRACVRSGGSASAGEPSALSHPTAVSNASAVCVCVCVRSGGSASAGEPSALSHPTAVSNASAMCVCVCARAPPSPWVYVRRAGDRMGGVCVRACVLLS